MYFDESEEDFWLRTTDISIFFTKDMAYWGNGSLVMGKKHQYDSWIVDGIRYSNNKLLPGLHFMANNVDYQNGIRPAFYLNEETALILSGDGSKENPYVMTGRFVPDRFEENGLYGYKNEYGEVIASGFCKALPFSDGAALVATKDDPYHRRYIDMDGNFLFDKAFAASNNFNNGYAVVLTEDSMYEFIDKTGEAANEMRFEDVEDFRGGFALVKQDGKWGAVDMKFNFTVLCECDTKEEAEAKLAGRRLK